MYFLFIPLDALPKYSKKGKQWGCSLCSVQNMYHQKTFTDKLKVFLLFAALPLLAFTIIVLIPFCVGIFVTLTSWNGLSSDWDFVGAANYITVLQNDSFWQSLGMTFKYVVFVLLLTNILAFGMALLVTSGFSGQNFFRAGYFTPNLIGGVILGFIWQFIFSRVLTNVGDALELGFLSKSMLTTPEGAFWALVIVGVWQSAGYMMLIYIAGLTGIDATLLEAASIDGASPLQRLLRIKLPLMASSFTITLFLTLRRAFMVYDVNLSLTKGGPYGTTQLLSMHIYNEAFVDLNYGSGQAEGIIMFVILAILSFLQVYALKKKEIEAL